MVEKDILVHHPMAEPSDDYVVIEKGNDKKNKNGEIDNENEDDTKQENY